MLSSRKIPTIELATGSDRETVTRDLLLDVLHRYDLDRWFYTDRVRIESGVISHSHPVLTLNTRYGPDQEIELVSTYIHEQLHWFWSRADHHQRALAVVEQFAERYPGLPVGPPEGCRTAFSNSLHVGINALELLALEDLVGPEAASASLLSRSYYRAVYALVVQERDAIVAILEEFDLIPPLVPPGAPEFIVPRMNEDA
jgi:hypothetical protein